METRWTVEVVADVVFARPQQFDGRAHDLGNPRGLHHAVVVQPPTEAAADAREVNGDVALRDAKSLCNGLTAQLRRLGGRPELERTVPVVSRAVLRLERRVRKKRVRVRSLHDLGGAA